MITVIDLSKLAEIDVSANFIEVLKQSEFKTFSKLSVVCETLNIDVNTLYCGKYQGRYQYPFIYDNYLFVEQNLIKGTKSKTNNSNLLNQKSI